MCGGVALVWAKFMCKHGAGAEYPLSALSISREPTSAKSSWCLYLQSSSGRYRFVTLWARRSSVGGLTAETVYHYFLPKPMNEASCSPL